jgi:UTP--glucose-1-phosphate uridylyltransferase
MSSSSVVRTAVLPVAGLGTRFLPVTKAVPKELLPLADRPCIEYVVVEAVAAGIENIVLVSARGKDAMVDYFDRSPALERLLEETGKSDLLAEVRRVTRLAKVVAVRQSEALGLGHAVNTARPAVGDRPFAVLLGDDVIDNDDDPAIGQLLRVHSDQPDGAVVALMEVPLDQVDRYGVCAGPMTKGRMRVDAMIEKPKPSEAPSRYAIVGRYILPPDIFDILDRTPRGRGGEVQLTDALAVLAQQGRVTGAPFVGRRFDTGHVVGLLHASVHFARKRPELRGAVDAMLDELRAG